MLEQHTIEELKRLMDSWSAAYKNSMDINKELAAIDVQRAVLLDKLTNEEKKARVAEEALNAMIEDIEADDEVAQVEELARQNLTDALMLGVVS